MKTRTGVIHAIGSFGLLAAVLAACGAQPSEPAPSQIDPSPASRDAEAYAAELVELTNETRTAENLDLLEESSCAREAALERAAALDGQGELAHAPLAPVIENCAPLTTAAENLVNSAASAADVIDAWLGSPGHRANIVDPALTEIGIGCVPDGENLLCSQVFLGP